LALGLSKLEFSISSFALGGQHYFEIDGAVAEKLEPIVEDRI
jgi:hypothetical protein